MGKEALKVVLRELVTNYGINIPKLVLYDYLQADDLEVEFRPLLQKLSPA